MLKLLKYLKPFIAIIAAIVILLLLQAICDLSLPDFTSKIVNVGIQQRGIENAVPKAIRKSEFDKLKLFMSEENKTKVAQSYSLLDKDSLSKKDYTHYVKDYPRLAAEPVYKLNIKDKKKIDELNLIMGRPILIVSEIEKKGSNGGNLTGQGQGKMQNGGASMQVPPGADPFAMISKLPATYLDAMKKTISDKFSKMPDSMITQGAVSYIHNEYDALGMATDKIQTNFIFYAGAVMLLIALLSMAATVVVGYLGARVEAGLSKNLRRNVFHKVSGFSNSEFDKFSTATLITRSTNDIQQIQMLMVMLLRTVFYAPILGLGGVFKVLQSDSSMGWIIGVAIAAIFVLVSVLLGIAIPKFKRIQKLVDRLNLVTGEILTGILVIRAFNTQKHEEKKFEFANEDLTRTNLFVNRVMAVMMPLMMLIMNGITLLIIWVGAHQVEQGAMQVGNLMAFIQYAMQIIMAFLMITMVSIMLPRATVSAERIGEVLEAEISITDPEKAEHVSTGKKGHVEFKHVNFRYTGAVEDVLTDITFTAKPGQTTAFIGSTGSGKTTLISLIPRFYDVTGGEILIDGTDIRKVTQHELREKIGYVPQKAVLFSGTIESNLKYGVASASDDELAKVAEIAQALEFINVIPEGMKANISQGGTNVSGGQKQRLSIARALARKPEIYIFDDSFSALDFKTDAALRKALKEATAQSAVLIVAQRISTIMNSDQIIVLEEGKIVGMGTHKELMKSCEVYQQIALSQLSKEELA